MKQRRAVVRFLAAILLALLMCDPFCNTLAQDWAKERLNNSPRHGEWVDLKSGERTIKAFVVYPERKEKTPVVLVVHEIFGLTDWVRGICDQLAENGVIAIAPDLLSGQTYSDIDGARKAISALSPEQIKADLDTAADYALKIPASNGTLAVCGFCWGGGVAFAYANENPKLQAAYSFYGLAGLTLSGLMGQYSDIRPAPDEASKVANISCPVYGFYGENDERVNATIPKAEELMKAAGKKYEPVIYKGAGHGFMREGESPTASEANKKARDDAWARWKKLLKQLP
jgi:carboxymethylenebutenolidase